MIIQIIKKLKLKKKHNKLKIAHKQHIMPNNCPQIKPIQPFNTAVFNYMNTVNGQQNKNTPNMTEFIEKNAQDFKKLTKDNQLKILFYYIKVNSKNGLFKRPSLTKIGEYFGGVHKNTIKIRLDLLESQQYIKALTELELKEAKNTYKILKNEF